MDIGSGSTYPANALSNFSPHAFIIDEIQCASLEGFLQSLKFKDIEMQKHICSLVGIGAKRAGRKKNWRVTQTLWWKGVEISRHSNEYQQLLDKAYRCCFEQNEKFRNALKASGNATLTHSIGKTKKSDTVLTVQEFCSRLTKLREKGLC